MKQIPLVRKVVLEPAISFLRAEGIPVERYLNRAKLTPPTPETSDSLMPLHQLCDFLNSISRAEGISDLGFHIAGRSGIQSLGLYGRLVMQTFTLHEFIQRSIQLISTYNSGVHIWTEQHGEQVKYCQRYDKSLPPTITREITHLGLANALSHASLVTRSAFTPRRIAISTGPTDLAQHFPSLNNLPFEFNRSHTTIWFDRRFLSQPLPAYEESHASQSVTDTERRRFFNSAPSSDLVGQLEQLIESSLGKTAVGIQLTAAMIGTSPRTLQRRLAEEGQDFGRLLQSIRFRTAQRLLQEPAMTVNEIARRLSYADSANFIRAFKRWTGVGPSEFRLLQYEEPSGMISMSPQARD